MAIKAVNSFLVALFAVIREAVRQLINMSVMFSGHVSANEKCKTKQILICKNSNAEKESKAQDRSRKGKKIPRHLLIC